ncbi:hypothetical protein ACC735_37970, partial [Rhizobium ruizarguesonis]
MQQCGILGDEALQLPGEKPHYLTLGDGDPDIVQQCRQPLRRHLSLCVQHQAKPPEVGAIATYDPGRQGS